MITKIQIDDRGYKSLVMQKPESDSGFFIGLDFEPIAERFNLTKPVEIHNKLFDAGFRYIEDWHKAGIHKVLVSALIGFEKLDKRDAKVKAFEMITFMRGNIDE